VGARARLHRDPLPAERIVETLAQGPAPMNEDTGAIEPFADDALEHAIGPIARRADGCAARGRRAPAARGGVGSSMRVRLRQSE